MPSGEQPTHGTDARRVPRAGEVEARKVSARVWNGADGRDEPRASGAGLIPRESAPARIASLCHARVIVHRAKSSPQGHGVGRDEHRSGHTLSAGKSGLRVRPSYRMCPLVRTHT